MTAVLTLDKAGRLVLPKSMRESLRLRPGARLTAEIVGDKIELVQAAAEVKLARRGRRRVVVGWEGFDAAQAVREMRREQEDHLATPSPNE